MATSREDLPIQPVNKPILCSPYEEPTEHWVYNTETGEATRFPGRRPASYWFKTRRTGDATLMLKGFAEEERDDLPLVNRLRADVKRWRELEYEGATPVTKQLLRYWARADRPRRLFFCQREAVETIIYLNEILGSGRKPRWKPELSVEDFQALCTGQKPSFSPETKLGLYPSLVDIPKEPGLPPLRRYGCKMATGSGKTVVMAMLIAWAFCNRGRVPGDARFPNAALVVCPNLTIKERLQVLRPEHPDNYYETFDLVPAPLRPELAKGKVLVTNWHLFQPESEHIEGGKSYAVVNKGPESPEAFARRVLGDLVDRAPLMVINDEAHHCYRPAPLSEEEKLTSPEREEREEATVWISGLDKINQACGIQFCVDLSATPFYLAGSGYIEGAPHPWLVSDFGLVDAIESGIVKIPRLPVSDTTGRPEPKYFALWKYILDNLQPGERLPGGKPKPEAVWREAQDALLTLASQWKERFDYYQQATPDKESIPPVMILVCDNTDIAELFYRKISGEETEEVLAEEADNGEENGEATRPLQRAQKSRRRITYGTGAVFPELLANRPDFSPTLRIDVKLLAQAESADPTLSKSEAAQRLREIVATVGKRGKPGEQIRCVVSVQMLNEGWDANNVTHILGLRAFSSQLLCEQVVGRGLRRMDYTPDPETGLLTEEYVDIYGVPFSVIPFRGRPTKAKAPEDKPKNHVRALDERKQYQIRFPIVEGFVFDLRRNLIRADVAAMEPLVLEPDQTPRAAFVKPQVGYQFGHPGLSGSFQVEQHDRLQYYASTHPQTIRFEIARQVVSGLTESSGKPAKLRLVARHQLFPQVLRLVNEYIDTRVDFRGCHPCELGLEKYLRRIVERLIDAIEPDETRGEPPLLPVLNRYKPIGSTAQVDFKTVRPCISTAKSHINLVVADTESWEQAAVFQLEESPAVTAYARNDHLEFTIPYEFEGVAHSYTPDFLVRLIDGSTVILEIKGRETEEDRAKHQAARRWVAAVNHWGRLGRWTFHVCRDPQELGTALAGLLQEPATESFRR
jgi:type III restriction enzyme